MIHSGFLQNHRSSKESTQLLSWRTQKSESNLVGIMMSHFMFESIHPFYDGNGRTGRYLLGIQLSKILSPATALTMSSAINQFRNKYYKAFHAVEHRLNRGDGTPFVISMLELLIAAQEGLIENIKQRIDFWQALRTPLKRFGVPIPLRTIRSICCTFSARFSFSVRTKHFHLNRQQSFLKFLRQLQRGILELSEKWN